MAMSIYKPAFERAVSDNDVTHTVRPSAATNASSPPEDAAAPDRRGFPIEVHRELEVLRDFYDRQHPETG